MFDENSEYASEFKEFLEKIYKRNGAEGLANSLPFMHRAFVVTLDAKIVAANQNFLDLIGYSREELYGKNALDITYIDDRGLVENRIKGNVSKPYVLRLVNKHSRIKYVYVSPHIFETDGARYRLAEFIDETEFFELKEKHIASLKNTALALANTIERRDPYTHGHMRRAAEISVQIARLLSLNEEATDTISLGASVHDIGKIAIPIEILIKPGKLEHYEWETIKQHPIIGSNILAEVKFVDTVKNIVLMHHEHQDGSGYPHGLKGCDIPIEVAIVSVGDSLEAIAGFRPYRKANTFEDSIEIMKRESHNFHPEVLAAAESLVRTGILSGMEYGMHN